MTNPRTTTLLSAFLLAFTLHAQDPLDAIAVSTCDCINAVDRKDVTGEALQMQLGLCMMKAAAPHEKELRKRYKIDMSQLDAGAGEKLGELVGMRLVGKCPEFLEFVAEMQEEGTTEVVEAAVSTVSGSVTGLRDRQFSTVLVKDVSGRTVELLRLEHFPNADLLVGAGATGVTGTFMYTVKELYDPVAGTYRAHNVLVGLELE